MSGFLTSIQGCIVAGKHIVAGKVRHSQRMNDALISVWILAKKDGQISLLLRMQSRTLGIVLTHSKLAVLRGSMDKNLRSIGLHTSGMLVAFYFFYTIICERRSIC